MEEVALQLLQGRTTCNNATLYLTDYLIIQLSQPSKYSTPIHI
jgi:hypothetical protein